jgi:hypothetical protein
MSFATAMSSGYEHTVLYSVIHMWCCHTYLVFQPHDVLQMMAPQKSNYA